MYKQKLGRFILLFLICTVSKSFSQITASPSFTGCAPFTVILSGVQGASGEFWNFGAAMGTSTLSSPNLIYTTAGTYNITYTAMVAGSPVSHNAQLVVNPSPSANFSAQLPASHCVPMVVSFAASGGAAGYTYSWAFGDLTPVVSGASVTHTYTSPNSYIPILVIMNPATSCTAIATGASTIHVSGLPYLNPTSSNGYVACAPPFTTNISSNGSASGSPLGGGLTYNWTFVTGSPATSNAANPGVVTFASGAHTITLTGTDNNQCTNTKTVGVTVLAPSVTAVIPATVCLNAAIPATITTNQGSAFISVVGSSVSTTMPTTPNLPQATDSLFFISTPGTHTIVVTVQPPGCQSFTTSQIVFVEQVVANFTNATPSITCHPSLIATYINLSTINSGASLNFTWNATSPPNNSHYGTPATSVIAGPGSPSFTFYQGSVNPYTIYQSYNPNITLNVQSNSIAQCKASLLLAPHTIARPTAWFDKTARQGCAPLTVTLTNHSFTHPDMPVTSYTWCNGATPPTFSTGTVPLPPSSASVIPEQPWTYTNAGTYYPYLIIQTVNGCIDISFMDTVIVSNTPTITATFPATVCAGQPVTINMSGTSGIDNWHVVTDKGFFSGCITNSSPTYAFTHVGTHSVGVTAFKNNCGSGNTLMTSSIVVNGPVGKFRYETTCTGNKKVVKFHIHLQECATATLNLLDGSPYIITGNPTGSSSSIITHTYSSTGNFVATLTSGPGVNPSCAPYVFKQTVKVRDPKARITWNNLPLPAYPNALACTKAPYDFKGDASTDVNATCGKGFTWFFETPTYTLAPLDKSGDEFHSIFTISPGPPPTTFALLVDPVSLDTFRYAGTYTIGLIVKDLNGCADSTRLRFRIGESEPAFTFAQNPVCLKGGNPVQIINTTQNNLNPPDVVTNYTFSFGDNSPIVTSTNPLFNPSHVYTSASSPSQTFEVMCIALNSTGCFDTLTKTVQINNPVTNFQSNKFVACLPLNSSSPIVFNANPGYATYSVNFGDSPQWFTSGTFSNVTHGYSIPGVYMTTLTIEDPAGCRATDSLKIHALGQPTAHITIPNFQPMGYCKGEIIVANSTSSANVTPIDNHIWSFIGALGPINSSSTLSLAYPYNLPVTTLSLTTSVQLQGASFCHHTATKTITIYNPIARASITPTAFCLGDKIEASVTLENSDVKVWQWFFGDFVPQPPRYPGPFTPTTVTYPYTIFPTVGSNGNATVTLFYANPDMSSGCKKSIEIPIRVIKVQSDFKHLFDDYAHCLKLPDTFTATATNFADLNFKYEWDFGDQSVPTSTLSSISHTYMQPGNYSVTLTMRDIEYGCTATSVKQMTVFPLPTATISSVATTCPDTPFLIEGQASPGVSGIVTGTLSPAINTDTLKFTSSNTFTTLGSITKTSPIFIKVKDNNSCENISSSITVSVQAAAPQVNWDTTVVIGQTVQLNAYAGAGFSYSWTPLISYLNCSTCIEYNPVSTTTANITYSVMVQDEFQCSVVKNTYHINIKPVVSLDVPTAFTPNGDGKNDVIFPGGWGIKKLIYFKVFNRWGQLIFESNDLRVGWDGVFNGVPQNIETYVYQVSVETFLDTEPTLSKTGTFKLLR